MTSKKTVEMSTLGLIAALQPSGEGVDGSVVDPEHHTNAKVEVVKKVMDHTPVTCQAMPIIPTCSMIRMRLLCPSCCFMHTFYRRQSDDVYTPIQEGHECRGKGGERCRAYGGHLLVLKHG